VLAADVRVRPVKELQREVFIGYARAAHFLVELCGRNFLHALARDFLETRIVVAQTQLQRLVRIREAVADDRSLLAEPERNYLFVFAQLSLEVGLLLSLLEADRLQDFLCGRRRRSRERDDTSHEEEGSDDFLMHSKRVLSVKY